MMNRRRALRLLLATLFAGLMALLFLTGCDAVKDLGKGLDDLFKGIGVRFP